VTVWNGFNYFISGPVGNNYAWGVLFPTGTGGMNQNIDSGFISLLNGRSFITAGIHLTGCDQGEEDYGSRYQYLGSWIQYMMTTYGLTTKPALYCQSRGLQGLNFACDAPSLVARVACLYPSTDPKNSYPGYGGPLSNAHNKSNDEFDAVKPSGKSVVSQYTPNAKAAALIGIPTCIWHGDSDTTVIKSLTTDIFAPQCHAYVKTLPGFGHQAPSLATETEMADFLQFTAPPSGAVQQ
jgi:hypothetical protein